MSAMIGNPLLLPTEGYEISRSVRLRSSASAYLNRTPGSATNRQTWTWSGWCKVGTISVARALFSAGADGSNYTSIDWRADNRIQLYSNAAGSVVGSIVWDPMVFRDPTAWYHIVIVCDTTNATQTSRFRFYVNGVQFTTISGTGGENTWPVQNANTNINNTVAHSLGRKQHGANEYFDGYLTENNFIDGQALTPSSFGETDAITGVWKPKKYTGTYGTNGFFLNFSDNSAASAAAIGKDYSGNGNNWTPNNISVTSGVTYDSMIDVPTLYADGGNGRGNYCTLNPLSLVGNTFSEANLKITAAANTKSAGTIALPATGKWYWECVWVTNGGASNPQLGLVSQVATATSANDNLWYRADGDKYDQTNTASAYGATWTTNDVIGVAVDMDAGILTFYKNNTSQGTAFSTITTRLSGNIFPSVKGNAAGDVWVINFGQRPFTYTPPTGFKALNTQNLPQPTIVRGNRFMDVSTYTGAGTTQSVTNSGAMQPDLVWLKSRSNTGDSHYLYDAVRGVNLSLTSNDTSAEQNIPQTLTSFNSNGFTLGTIGGAINGSGRTFVGWQWKEGATQGFDIVTYTGTGVARTVAHSLGVAPKMMIVKTRSAVSAWLVYHASLGTGKVMVLNGTNAVQTLANYWDTAPDASNISLGNSSDVNASGSTFVAYLFSEVAGFSKFGSYTGNGSTDGPFCFTGFRPAFVMVKRTDATNFWLMMDTTRNTYNVMGDGLLANTSGAEFVWNPSKDILSNGFKVRTSDAAENASGGTYIYAAFASNPFKNSLAR